jgi:hypothetical protein
MQKVTVLYVAGTGRSGSTLLGNMLGQVPGFFSGGEINNLFKRGMLENWYCGCGERFGSCPVWSDVLARAFGPDGVDAAEMAATLSRLGRVRAVPALVRARGQASALGPAAGNCLDRLDRLYRALAEGTRSQVIVDSSKSPSYGQLLQMLPSVDLHVVHLIRDPRGTAFSWKRSVIRTDGAGERPMQQMSLAKASALWGVWNLTAEAVWARSPVPYLRLRYEDLTVDPAGSVRAAAGLAGFPAAGLDFIRDGSVTLDPHHTISGNPMRLRSGEVELKPDMEWVSAMPIGRRLMVTALTAHSLSRYGYPLGRPQQLSFSRLS